MAQGIQYDVLVRELVNWEPEFVYQAVSDIPPLSEFDSVKDDDMLASGGGDFNPGDHEKDHDMEDGEIGLEDSEKTYTDKETRGAGFVDRNGRFFPTFGGTQHVHHEKGVDESGGVDCSASRVVKPTMPVSSAPGVATVSVQQEDAEHPQKHDGATAREGGPDRATSVPLGARSTSAWSHGSVKILKKRVPVHVTGLEDIMKQYLEMGMLLGYDMESNKEKVKVLLESLGAINVDQ
ncbi:hypothetical protein L2E82_09140 [Cichorium intybus]|uniref:Uncharacterized protein n=1 Tax=Cichorium intybus TaxID=13427 RepID=A0ACB9G7M0_CICIN|nr:hypothetical protein L2E82_09140 [Cichorium intybus]